MKNTINTDIYTCKYLTPPQFDDVILFSDEMTLEELEANKYYTTVKAVKNDHAYKINAASFERMTLKMADYLDIIADELAK